MNTKRVLNLIGKGDLDRDFIDIYVDVEQLEYQKDRYQNAIMKFMEQYGDADIQIFSAPGRSEIGGNHTDHQHGKVLACAINKDVIGIVKKESTTENKRVEEEVNTLKHGDIESFLEYVKVYQKYMNQIFGYGSCSVLKIRKYGGIQVI